MMLKVYDFIKPSKAKGYIFLALLAYFVSSLIVLFPFFPESVNTVIGWFFLPALYLMLMVAQLFGVGFRGAIDGKGPGPSDAALAFSWVSAFLFGVFLLYLIACGFGAWYESVHRRVNKI